MINLTWCEKLNDADKSINTIFLNEETTVGNIALYNKWLSIVPDFWEHLSWTWADDISSIDLSWNQITTLDWNKFEVFKNLKEINVSFNKINKIINLDKLKSIKIFHWVQNSISNTDWFENLKKLQVLDLSFNQIVSIDSLAESTALININLAHNKIIDVTPLSKLEQLSKLKLEFNSISDISALYNNKKLRILTVSNNNLSDELIKELNEMSLKNMQND